MGRHRFTSHGTCPRFFFLFALKKQLLAWDFADNSVRVDVDNPSKTLKVEGKIIVTVTCADGQLVCDWANSWKNWTWLHDSTEFKAIIASFTKLLGGGMKGNGKGKPH